MDSEGWEAELARGALLARGQAGRRRKLWVGRGRAPCLGVE